MDFYSIQEKDVVRGKGEKKELVSIDIYPDFIVGRSKDLMIRGKSFYAVWDQEKGLWSTDAYDVQRLVDEDMYNYRDKLKQSAKSGDATIKVMSMRSNRSKMWSEFTRYVATLADNYHQLDENLTFLNTEVKKEDYVSKRLPYALGPGDYSAWDTLVGELYDPQEREKIEWAIGAVVSGDSKKIQKFCVFYGDPGAGKGTIITIIQLLFDGYYTTFDAKSLGSSSNQFATEAFRSNPLVGIQHDGDLSRIEDNTRINSIVSHEMMTMKEKFKPEYMGRANAFLFMGTNRPVKITDGKSGVIRRLIDIHPSGRRFSAREYDRLMDQIPFQLGAIAHHCLEVYKECGKNYYRNYTPRDMIMKTDVFYNFVEANLEVFMEQEGMTLKQAYAMYKEYCDDALVEFKLPRHKFREELKSYYSNFEEIGRVDGRQVRSWYSGFKKEKMVPAEMKKESDKEPDPLPLDISETASILDEILKDCPAQYTKVVHSEDIPAVSWDQCKTRLSDIDPSKLHYILPRDADGNRINILMMDFDLKNERGEKDARLNIEAAAKWPETYTEFSKGGEGIHMFYWYDGDLNKLSSLYAPGIEIKTFPGNSSIRRRLSKCLNRPIATLHEGSLPMREEKVIDFHELKDQQHLINKIKRALRKGDNVGGTKCEIDLIKKTLDDAYSSGMVYDVSDLENDILMFAMDSTNNAQHCVEQVAQMKFKSKVALADVVVKSDDGDERKLIIFDTEIYRPTYPGELDADGRENPGFFLICWKVFGEGQEVHAMPNPKPYEVEAFLKMGNLGGYNNLNYDNGMLYFAMSGYNNGKLYDLSKRIIDKKARGVIPYEAKQLSYLDVYDICSEKKSLKKWEIELDIDHDEMEWPWDQPAPRSMWNRIIEYCKNDVLATEAVLKARNADFKAREILAEIAHGRVNNTSNELAGMFIFNGNKHPQLVYTDLKTGERSDGSHDDTIIGAFPEYEYYPANRDPFGKGKARNMYRGVDLGFGGYSYSEPGVYVFVALIDVRSLHPTSMSKMKYFGDYAERFDEILELRLAVKDHDFERARTMLGGAVAKYLDDESQADALAQALKIVINSCYGLTSASFENLFRDSRNVNNIVALRGALFMKTLLDDLQSQGITVAHLKVDSIKVPNATPEIVNYCMDFAKKYGYTFEHEAVYDRMCIIDKSNYIAAYKTPEECEKVFGYVPSGVRKHFKKHDHPWTATGDAFQHPYVFKTLFSGEPVTFKDMCEIKSVQGAAIYLDFNEGMENTEAAEKELERRKEGNPPKKAFADWSIEDLEGFIARNHHYEFVGRVGNFFPVRDGVGGGELVSLRNGKYGSVNGTKGYRWLEAKKAKKLGLEKDYSPKYFDKLLTDAIEAARTKAHCNFESFVDLSKPYEPLPEVVEDDRAPWDPVVPCGDGKYNTCFECPEYGGGDVCKRGYSLATYINDGGN